MADETGTAVKTRGMVDALRAMKTEVEAGMLADLQRRIGDANAKYGITITNIETYFGDLGELTEVGITIYELNDISNH